MNTENFLGMVQEVASRSRALSLSALKVRNQCNAIIANYIGKENRSNKNGECWFLDQYLSPNTKLVIDVGANRGDWSKIVLKSGPDTLCIHSYEPDPRVVDSLEVRFNTLDNIHIHKTAIGESVGEVDLFLGQKSTELTTATPMSKSDYTVTKTRVTTLDEESDRHNFSQIDLLKVDVEGYESAVLKGASSLLKKEKINCIQFEYGRNWRSAGATLYSVVERLRSFGFSVYLLRPRSLRKVNFEGVGEYFSYSNYIAIHDQAKQRVDSLIHPQSIL